MVWRIGKTIEHAPFDRQQRGAAAVLREAKDTGRRLAKIAPVLPKRNVARGPQEMSRTAHITIGDMDARFVAAESKILFFITMREDRMFADGCVYRKPYSS